MLSQYCAVGITGSSDWFQTHLQNHDATAFTNPIDHFRTKDKNEQRKASQLRKQRQSLLVA